MKTARYLTLVVSCILAVQAASAQPLTQWTLQQEGSQKVYKAHVPCTVAGILNENGAFGPAVLEQLNYKGVDKSPFDSPWVFTTTFKAGKGQHHVLRFDSLNWYAQIELNGTVIASADTTWGNFCVREFDITPLAQPKNSLKVTLRRARKGDLNTGYVDWNPRPADESMGINGPVTLISTPDVQVKDVFVKPIVNPENLSEARIVVSTVLVNLGSSPVEGKICGVYEGGCFTGPVHLKPGETRTFCHEESVKNPRIWWTREMGSPELYHMDLSFVGEKERVSHHKKVTFGIRSITSEVDKANHRVFYLNGKRILVKSGGWTDDIFMQDTPEKLEQQVQMTLDMGLNCIRFENIWGKDDTVYDLCDRMGVLALVGWSCQWEWEEYCGLKETKGFGCINDPRSEATAVRYFRDQVVRLRNHPSVMAWMTGSDRIPNARLEKQYLAIYEKEDYRPYVCSAKGLKSLAGHSGMKMEGPYEYVGPDYWYLDTKRGGAYGFNTETGPGLNIPQEESLRQMLGQKDLWPIGPSWAYHCTASASHMNNTAILEKSMEGVYGKAGNLHEFVHRAHALDYDATRAMFEAFRCNVPEATGIVMWMLNSAWPSLYWQLYDWYNIPTAGYYGTRTGNAPVQLVYNYAKHQVYAVNDAVAAGTYTAKLQVYDTQCKLVREDTREITVNPCRPVPVFDNVEGPCFVQLQLEGNGISATNFYAVPAGYNQYEWKRADWWGIPIKEYASLAFVSALPATQLEMKLSRTKTGYEVTLHNPGNVIAYQNILKAVQPNGMLVPGAVWSDNFVTLVPGATRTLTCTLPKGCRKVKIKLSGWNATAK